MKNLKLAKLSHILLLTGIMTIQTMFISSVKAEVTTYEYWSNRDIQAIEIEMIENYQKDLYTKCIKSYATNKVHIRSSDSKDSESIKILNVGDEVYKISDLDNGWTKIKYDGKIRFIKSEYIMEDYDFEKETKFTKTELDLLYGIVNAEIGDLGEIEERVNVASVIFNRLESDEFPNVLYDVLTAKSQFTTYFNGRWKKLKCGEMDYIACKIAWKNRSTKANFFDSGYKDAIKRKGYLFTDDSGTSYYYRTNK